MKSKWLSLPDLLWLVFLILLLPLTGCSGGGGSVNGGGGSSQTGGLRFTIAWPAPSRLIPAGAYSVLIAVTAPGQTIAPQLVPRPSSAGTTTTLFSNLPKGNVTVIATAYPYSGATGNSQATATQIIPVVAGTVSTIALSLNTTVQNASITPLAPSVTVGGSISLAALAMDNSGAVVLTGGSTWSWSSSNVNVATVAASGDPVTVQGVGPGTAVLTATETESGKSAQVTVTVVQSPITITPTTVTLLPGGTQQFSAAINGVSSTSVTWSVVEGASGGTVSTSGLYTAPATTGTYHVQTTSSASGLSAAATVTVSSVVGNGGLASSPWPKYGGNAQNTWQGTGTGATGTLKWLTPYANGATVGQYCIIGSDGTIYATISPLAANNLAIVRALDGSTGNQKWSFSSSVSLPTSTYYRSVPALSADGTLYIGAPDRYLYALNAATGAKKWATLLGGVVSTPTIGTDGTVYVGSADGHFYALNGTTGAILWSFSTPVALPADPAILCPALGSDGTVYISSGSDQNLYALNPKTGALKWTYAIGEVSTTDPSIGSNGNVYVVGYDGTLFAVNGTSGTRQWQSTPIRLLDGLFTNIVALAVGTDNTVYLGITGNAGVSSVQGYLFAFNGATGSQNWKVLLSSTPGGCYPTIGGDNRLYINIPDQTSGGVSTGNISALIGETVIWTYSLSAGDGTPGRPALGADGTLYFSGGSGVYAVH